MSVTNTRISVPSDLAADVVFASDSTCCVCRERGKAVQIHHVDEDPNNNTFPNLAVLCLEYHNHTQVTGGFGRKLTDTLVIKYREECSARVVQRRDAADRVAVEKMVGPAAAAGEGSVETLPYSRDRADAILAYVQSLPDLRSGLRTWLGRWLDTMIDSIGEGGPPRCARG
jgi:hypothetical protein